MKNILITGANGFVGSNLVKLLYKENYSVKALVRKNSNTELLPDTVKVIRIDYKDKNQLERNIAQSQVVIHIAARTRAKNWAQFKKANIDLTANLVEIVNKTKSVKQFIFISSLAAAGPAIPGLDKKETDLCVPVSLYGKSKLEAENIVKTRCKKQITILRPVSVFGPGDTDFLSYFKMIKKHISVKIGHKRRYLSLIYVEDFVKIIEIAVLNPKFYNQTLFVANKQRFSWDNFIKAMEKALNKKTLTITIPEMQLKVLTFINSFAAKLTSKTPLLNPDKLKEMKQEYWVVDTSCLEKITTTELELDLVEKLKITYRWYKAKGWL